MINKAAKARLKFRFPLLLALYRRVKGFLRPLLGIYSKLESTLYYLDYTGYNGAAISQATRSQFRVISSYEQMRQYVHDELFKRLLLNKQHAKYFEEKQPCYALVDGDRIVTIGWLACDDKATHQPLFPKPVSLSHTPYFHSVVVTPRLTLKKSVVVEFYKISSEHTKSLGFPGNVGCVWDKNKFGNFLARATGCKEWGKVTTIKLFGMRKYVYSNLQSLPEHLVVKDA